MIQITQPRAQLKKVAPIHEMRLPTIIIILAAVCALLPLAVLGSTTATLRLGSATNTKGDASMSSLRYNLYNSIASLILQNGNVLCTRLTGLNLVLTSLSGEILTQETTISPSFSLTSAAVDIQTRTLTPAAMAVVDTALRPFLPPPNSPGSPPYFIEMVLSW